MAVEIKFNSNPGSFGKTTFVEDPNLTAALQKTRENSSAAEVMLGSQDEANAYVAHVRTHVRHITPRIGVSVRTVEQPNGHVLVQFKGKTLGTQGPTAKTPTAGK